MLKNMKIGKKLIICFILVAFLASISGIVSMVVIKDTNVQYEDALIDYGFSQGDIGKAMLMISDNNRCVRDIIGFTNQADIASAKTTYETNLANYEQYIANVQETLSNDAEHAQYQKIEAALSQYRAVRDEVIMIGDTTDPSQSARAQRMAVDQLDPLYNELYGQWNTLMEMNVTTGNHLSNDLTRQGNLSLLLTLGLTVVSFLISIALGVGIARSISVPVTACANRLVMLAQGDLHAPVPEATSRDETGIMLEALKSTTDAMNVVIGEIGRGLGEVAKGNLTLESDVEFKGDFNALNVSLNTIIESLNDTLGQIGLASDQVASGSDQVSSGAQALSQGATEQASSVQELSATITEISDQTKKNAENASNARTQSERAGHDIIESNKKMQEMISAMNDISDKSNEIGKIIKTIDDIAFQTNILALNAAVEAARAGAAGKGFAVVADEVRNLAGKSAEAAKNTAVLIQEAIQAIENGTAMADDAAHAILSVVESAKAVTSLVEHIASDSNEQANAITQVNSGVEQISSVVQTNSATAEESAAASEELSGQAQMLRQLVGKFRLKNASGFPSRGAATELAPSFSGFRGSEPGSKY